jgi:hypothetical protein
MARQASGIEGLSQRPSTSKLNRVAIGYHTVFMVPDIESRT